MEVCFGVALYIFVYGYILKNGEQQGEGTERLGVSVLVHVVNLGSSGPASYQLSLQVTLFCSRKQALFSVRVLPFIHPILVLDPILLDAK